MSTKKDKFSSQDKHIMKLAFNIASSRKGLTGNNPSVGCVITKKNKIISIGRTGLNGRPHAEYSAIKDCHENLQGSKMYVTLEPCNHYGKTPPCTKKIIKSGISQIYYPIDDIDKKVKGKSFRILTKNKIKVHKGLLKNVSKVFYRSYNINRIHKLPFVTGKIAVSKNNLIYSNLQKRITNEQSDKFNHLLRYKNDSILISYKTLNKDNPKLNCRIKGLNKFSPRRIILDDKLNTKINSYIMKTANEKNTLIFYNKADKSKVLHFKKKKVQLIQTKTGNNNKFNIKIILKKLYKIGCRNLLVEGGDFLTNSLIKKKIFNQFYLFKSSKNLIKSKDYLKFSSFNLLNQKYKKKNYINLNLRKDRIILYKN